MQTDPNKYPNLSFHLSLLKDPSYHLPITSYHLHKRGDYKFLQSSHSYIQWLFPNHYPSRFNSTSHPLTQHQAKQFRINPTIGRNIIMSYQMIMDFMGIRLKCVRTGELAVISEMRLENVLIKNIHNHLRLMRIIACLSTVGFRTYGMKLIGLLDEVTGRDRYKGVRGVFVNKWKVYQNDDKAKEMCFLNEKSLLGVRNCVLQDQEDMERMQRKVEEIQKVDKD